MQHDAATRRAARRGISLVEFLAVAVIMAVLAAAAIARFAPATSDAQQNACYVHQGEIEVQAQLWHRRMQAWPAADLSDIGGDPQHFPDGQLPTCPAGGTYSFNAATGEVTCSHHP